MIRADRLAALLLCLSAATARADTEEIRVALPEQVELAEIQPGLQVVTRLDLEVFAQDGVYWLRHSGRWFSSRRPLEGFQAVEPRGVPAVLAALAPGRYLEYRARDGQRVTQRHIGGAAPADLRGVEVDAAGAKMAPRGTLLAPPPAPKPAAAEPTAPAAPAARAQAKPQPKAQAKPASKPPPAKKAPPKPPAKKPAAAKPTGK
jgi:hypothetical protein